MVSIDNQLVEMLSCHYIVHVMTWTVIFIYKRSLNAMTKEQLVKLFDHTCLYAYATEAHMKKLCDEARTYNFAMVAVNSVQVKRCKEFLKDTDVHVGAAIGFPLGQTTIASKVFETVDAIRNGADEVDYVINITELKEGNYDYIREEMRQIVEECRKANVISKVIFENCYLTKEEIEALESQG